MSILTRWGVENTVHNHEQQRANDFFQDLALSFAKAFKHELMVVD